MISCLDSRVPRGAVGYEVGGGGSVYCCAIYCKEWAMDGIRLGVATLTTPIGNRENLAPR